MFWGLIMEPNKRYTQTVEKAFHVSMATLDVTTTTVDEVVQVMLGYENRNYLLCNLKKSSQLQVALDLNFKEGTKIAFTSNGHGHVHLTGYLIPEDDLDDFDDMDDEEGEEEEEEEEVPQLVENQGKRKAQASPTDAKSTKRLKAQTPTTDDSEEESSDDENDQEDSDEEGESLEAEAEDSDEEEGEEESDDDEEEEEEEEEVVEETKPQKKNKQKQEQQQPKQQQKKQKEQKQNNSLTNGKDVKTKQITKEGQSPNNSQVQKKKFSINGVQIEDLKVGNGDVAKPGKTVAVYYTGRLKNGKIFDSTKKGNGFKFRLGKGEVIKGWDIGVSGMKVGGKRTLTIPPNLAYGQKGSPPVIPGNSTLTFEVELKEVH